MRSVVVVAFAAGSLLAGCAASYENRIAERLSDAGLSRPVAKCMAGRMADRLSTGQLKRLARFGGTLGDDVRDMTLSEVSRRFAAIGDPEIVEVVTRAGLGCAIAAA
jgi:hypothetical protein